MIRKILFTVVMSAFSLCMISPISNIAEASAEVVEPEEETGTYSLYRWYYKVENGVKYMRLWDGTAQCWVTDWIRVEE